MKNAFVLIAMLLTTAVPAFSDGFMIPVREPERQIFSVKYHHVTVNVNGQTAVTKVDQIFRNHSDREQEGKYIFPLPEGATFTKFSMFVDEREVQGKILDKTEARRIYESIVRSRKDPALLEYIDRNTFQASVYPIPANGEKRIRLEYCEVLKKNTSTIRYVYPLSTERFSSKPLEDVKVTIRLKDSKAIRNIYSPSHQIEVEQDSDKEATVRWDAKDVKPDQDVILYWTIANHDVGIDLLTYREKGDKGFFMLLASPPIEVEREKVIPKNVLFVLDRTGSMAGEKMEQAKGAVKFCLNSLNPNDHFNLITFNERPELFERGLVEASKANIRSAVKDVEMLDATGGTNINAALVAALEQFKEKSGQNYIVFVTDGLPTVGERDISKINESARSNNKYGAKIFTFGVGYDVNTVLLDLLAKDSKADSDYVRPNEDIEAKVSEFFAKVNYPLLTDLALDFQGMKVTQLYPSNPLPDLFRGGQLIVLGRYDGSGPAKILLTGSANGKRRNLELSTNFPAASEQNDFLPRLWAARRIGYLLDEIRLHSSKELIDEVASLSKKYGIPTAYTSFLADERDAILTEDMAKALTRANVDMLSVAPPAGAAAVSQSQNTGSLRRQTQVGAAARGDSAAPAALESSGLTNYGSYYYDAEGRAVQATTMQNVANRTFYRRGQFWVDQAVEKQQVTEVKQFSDAHFKLMSAYPALGKFSSLGNIQVVINDQVLQIGPEGQETLTDAEIKRILSVQ